MKTLIGLSVFLSFSPTGGLAAGESPRHVELRADTVADKILGGLTGQLLGNLNGLKYEFKFGDEPGNVEEYTPGLPEGARTDDDTDIEWVYVIGMQRSGKRLLPYDRVAELWKRHINRKIWVANRCARNLMSLGIEPPLTGSPALNPRSDYNISGQFVCEVFGLICPGMPQSAARTGLHYTHVTIDGEPAQATQLFTSMIATAFLTDDMNAILDAGLASVDAASQIHEIVTSVRAWHAERPQDWRATRRRVKEKYFPYRGGGNGYGVCTASVIAALLYGRGDFPETVRLAFNYGWDADNTAATAATVLGVIKGRRWMDAQGWKIRDRYRNTTRDAMPTDETISRFAERLVALFEMVLAENGGAKVEKAGGTLYRIPVERPANVEKLRDPQARYRELRAELKSGIAEDLMSDEPSKKARGAYLAICLDLQDSLGRETVSRFESALKILERKLEPKQYSGMREKVMPHLKKRRRD